MNDLKEWKSDEEGREKTKIQQYYSNNPKQQLEKRVWPIVVLQIAGGDRIIWGSGQKTEA
jgi:hypothetical protein